MAIDIQRSLDFGNSRRILNLPDGVGDQEPATIAQLKAQIEGLAWKDNVKVSTQSNINLTSPGASINGITMVLNDRVLVPLQSVASENGIYIWNGAAVPMTRSLDANTADELNQAIVSVDQGSSANSTYRQSALITTISIDSVTWGSFGATVGPASTASTGVVQVATLSEVNAGTDALKVVTPDTLANSNFASRKLVQNIGDASATSYTVTHNFNTRDVEVGVYRNGGNYDSVLVEIRRTSVNSITIVFDDAPASNAYRVIVRA